MAKKEETKTVFIPKDRINNEDVLVSINDRNYLIKRGVPVEVPLSVAEVLENQQKMLDQIDAYNEANAQN